MTIILSILVVIKYFAFDKKTAGVDSPRYVTRDDGEYYDVKNSKFVSDKADASAFNAHGMFAAMNTRINIL